MNVLDLFSGIGGFSLGLERAGMRTVAFCEIDPFCRRVLTKHWPGVPIYDDVRTLTAERLRTDGVSVDVICGGFPCQDISLAGKGVGIEGERSGLWSDYARIIGELRPRYVIVENVSALLARGIERVLGDLATLGYDAEWHCIPASAVGAPHYRDRFWAVAYPGGKGRWQDARGASRDEAPDEGRPSQYYHLAASDGEGGRAADVADANGRSLLGSAIAWPECHPWCTEPNVGRVAHGVPARVDRLRSLGNAVVPQIPELIGRAIMSAATAA